MRKMWRKIRDFITVAKFCTLEQNAVLVTLLLGTMLGI
jgi:hypothetical protein